MNTYFNFLALGSNAPKSYREIVEKLLPLQDNFWNAFQRVNHSDKDARGSVFLNCRGILGNNIMILNTLSAIEEGRLGPEKYKEIFGLASGDMSFAVKRLSQYSRLTFTTMLQFQIENSFANILAKLTTLERPVRGFRNIVSLLLDSVSIANKEDKMETLLILQYIRNTGHSNGIHNNNNLRKSHEDIEYVFERGKMVECAGWIHLAPAIRATINVMVDIFLSPKIEKIPEVIPNKLIE